MNSPHTIQNPSRREFLRTGTAAVAGSVVVWGLPAMLRGAPNDRELTLGLVGCGGRGTGAASRPLLPTRTRLLLRWAMPSPSR